MRFVYFLLLICFVSCKDNFKPIDYTTPADTTNWENQYINGGLIPSGVSTPNALIGTRWVLVKMVSGFSTTFPYDTIKFVTGTSYNINNGIDLPYQLSSGVASTNKTLSLYYFTSFGGSHYSGEVGYNFIIDGVINNAEFRNIQNSTDKIKAWFVKL